MQRIGMRRGLWIVRVRTIVLASSVNPTRTFPGSIPTGSIEKQRGEIDWIIILFFLAAYQVWQLSLFLQTAKAWQSSYQALEDEDSEEEGEKPREFEALGQLWKRPKARIDYGANNQKEQDAEALCIIGRERLLPEDFSTLRCE